MLGSALATQQPAQTVAAFRDQLGLRKLDHLIADQGCVAAGKNTLVGKTPQSAVVELDLDAVHSVPTPSRPGRQLGHGSTHNRRQFCDRRDYVIEIVCRRLKECGSSKTTDPNRARRNVETGPPLHLAMISAAR